MTMSLGATYVEPGYVASDPEDGILTGNVTVTGSVDTGVLGNYTLQYDVTDSSGNAATTQNRTVYIVPDTVLPVITLSDQTNMTLSAGATYVEPGYTATDAVDGDITANVTVTGTVDTSTTGTYTLHYDVSDSFGNNAIRQVRTVNVVD